MKKLFFSLVAATMAATATFAQSSMLATLSHNGEISTYYGASALRDAYNASANGDIITLSGGSFNAVDIEKGITIRGAGMAIDSTSQTEPTVIIGDFNISVPDTISKRLTLEGIYSNHIVYVNKNLKNATFLKDRFYKITYNNTTTVTNLTMIHCRVANSLTVYQGSVSCVNCVVVEPSQYTVSKVNYEFVNSVVIKQYFSDLNAVSYKNCILHGTGNNSSNSYAIPVGGVAYNCVGIVSYSIFNNIPNTTNVRKQLSEVFKTYNGTFNDDELFELTDDAKTTLLGLDGTQVGMYGGNLPFSPTPTNPQITKCNVAAKSTADGKLSVDITVNGAE